MTLHEQLAEAKRLHKHFESESRNYKIQPWQSQAEFLQEKERLRRWRLRWSLRASELAEAVAALTEPH